MLSKGPYNSQEIEPNILKYWLENQFFKPEYHPERGLISTEEMKNDERESFCIVNPPPNAYMRPHIGNVSGYAYQDVFLRFNRMKGKKVLGQPGKDHAGIQGEVVVEKIFLENKGKGKKEMGRDKFYYASYAHFQKLMPKVMQDEQRIGLSSDYDRNLFTLDPKIVKTVLGTFIKMFKEDMVYKGVRIVNWDPVAQTTLADIDTERVERDTELVYIKYPFIDAGSLDKEYKDYITVATTRAETMLGDTAVVVNPKDNRYKDIVGRKLRLPLTGREIPVITSPHVDMEFGTGAVKLTPAHSMDDYKMMTEWNEDNPEATVGYINVINKEAKMTGPIPEKYKGMATETCRKEVIQDLEAEGLILKREPHSHSLMIGERSKAVIEQIMSSQWFIDVEKLKQPAIEAVEHDKVKIHPSYMKKKYLHWMENLHDWPVSRSLWWGYRIPVWYKGEIKETINEQTGQIQETINNQIVTGIYDAVEKGLAKVQQTNPDLEKNFAPIFIPGRLAPEIKTLFADYKKIYPFAQIADTGEVDQTYNDYKLAFDQLYFDNNSVIMAHSLGAPAILEYLLANQIKVRSIILLAPSNLASKDVNLYKSRGFWRDYEKLPEIKNLTDNLTVIYSDNDPHYKQEELEDFADHIQAEKILEPGKQHFLTLKHRDDSKALETLLEKEAQEAGAVILHVVRHGETEDNKYKKFCGWRETPLNETGKKQAEDFGNMLKEEKYDMIISSPLPRAKETAEIIAAKTGTEVQFDDRLKERNFGVIEGKSWEEIQKDLPDVAVNNFENYQPDLPEGETIEEVVERVDDFVENLNQFKGKKVLLITHTGVLRILRRQLLSESVESTRNNDTENLGRIAMSTGYSSNWIQDPDVFDTWFSSGQWAYATLTANDLMDTFYPTDIMETAYDILELWVSRMIILGIYTQGEIPFKHVYLHGLVKAPDGQKMSKSKGNVIQPEEIINQYGADALRLMYIVGNKAGAGYPVSYEKLEGYKRFLNKIWNASKFVLNNIQDLDASDYRSLVEKNTNEQDKAILDNLKNLTADVTRHIEKFRIGLAAELLYQNFWHTFCDEHLENVKPRLYTRDKDGNPINTLEEDIKSRKEAQATLLYALTEYLKLMHPFIPFITEAIWQELPKQDGQSKTIMHAKWDN